MEIVVPVLIIIFIVSLVLIPTILDAWFMRETDKLNCGDMTADEFAKNIEDYIKKERKATHQDERDRDN
jgi:nitrogen fixation/metabolism regulation signal transduction histidine kinase